MIIITDCQSNSFIRKKFVKIGILCYHYAKNTKVRIIIGYLTKKTLGPSLVSGNLEVRLREGRLDKTDENLQRRNVCHTKDKILLDITVINNFDSINVYFSIE